MSDNHTSFKRFDPLEFTQRAMAVFARHKFAQHHPDIAVGLAGAPEYFFENSLGVLYGISIEVAPEPATINKPALPLLEELHEDRLLDAVSKGVRATHQRDMRPLGTKALVIHVQRFTGADGTTLVLDVKFRDRQAERLAILVQGKSLRNT